MYMIYRSIQINQNVLFGFYLKILTLDEPKKLINFQPRLPFLKPKQPSTGSAFYPVLSKSSTTGSNQCPTLNSCQNVCRTFSQCKQTLSESISTQMLIEHSQEEDRTHSPVQTHDELDNITMDVPHEIRSLLPPNNNVRSISPSHLVVFPPEIPPVYRNYCRSKTSTPQLKHEINVETKSEYNNMNPSTVLQVDDSTVSQSNLERLEISEPNDNQLQFDELENTSTVVQEYEIYDENKSDHDVTISTVQQVESIISRSSVECLEVVEPINDDRESCEHNNVNPETSDVVRQRQISNTVITEPVKEPKLQVCITEDNRAESPMVAALKTAPERSYSPLPTFVDASEFIPKQIEPPVEEKPMTMAEALAIAPDRSYKLPESTIKRPVGNNPVRYVHGYNKKEPVEPLLMTRSLIYTPASAVDSGEEQIAILGLKSFPPVSDELKWSTAAGDFDRTESNFENSEELVFDHTEIEAPEEPAVNEEIDVKEFVVKSIPKHPFTASGLHEPSDIPRYQQSIPENPHRATPSDKSSGKLIGPGIQDKVFTFTPKVSSIKDISFLKQDPNVHTKIAPILGYEPSSLEGGSSKSKSTNPIVYTTSNSEPNSSNYSCVETVPKFNPVPESIKEFQIPSLTPQNSLTKDDTLVEPVAPMFKTSLPAALLSKKLTCLTKKQQPKCVPTPIPVPDIGGQPSGRAGVSAGLTAPRRGRGVLNPQNLTPGARVPLCGQCNLYIRGPFITALGKIWCPEHFVCTNDKCKRPLQDIGFVEEDNGLYCEYCFEQFLAPVCNKCSKKIKGDCLNAIGKQFHPECFNCTYCGKLFGNSPFFLEDALPYCENDWNELFTTKCIACGFPIEAGDRWVEALNNNYHSPCFNCSKCKTNLEGQSFFAKGGRPYCKSHAR